MKFKTNISKWKKFPDVETLGYYHSLGNYISLNQFENEIEFEKVSKNPSINRNKYAVYIHERQHYLDHISTSWGIKSIYKIYRGFDSMIMLNEHNFHKTRELYLSLKRDYFLDYYTTVNNPIHGSYANPWKFQLTIGARFSNDGKVNEDYPIPFISFASSDDKKITRVPISVVSLLETTATYAEYNFKIQEILKLEPPFKKNQLENLSKEIEKKIYHPELALYSAAVHLASVHLQITDPIVAYKISSLFAKIALNMPSLLFNNIVIPEEFQQTAPWLKRCKKLLEIEDRGITYYLLIKNYADKYGKLINTDIPINNILSASNLPNEDEMEKVLNEEIVQLDYDVIMERNNFSRLIIDKIHYGRKFREATGIGQQNKEVDLSEFIREEPHLIFNSTYFEYEGLNLTTIVEKIIKQHDITREEWFRFHTHFEGKMDEFDLICGI